MRPITPELLEEVTRRLVEALGPEEIILFGPYADGTPDKDDDLKLLIVVPDGIPGFEKRDWALRALESIDELPVPFTVLVRPRSVVDRASKVSASLAGKIAETGKLLYGPREAKVNQAMAL